VPPKIRVLLCDDQRLFRDGLRTILESEPDFEVVGEGSDGVEGVEMSLRLRPDLVVLDIRMPRMDGVEATRRIRAAGGPAVVILSTYDDDDFIVEALKAGAVGYLLKDFPSDELVKALRTIHHGGGVLIPPPVAAKIVEELRRDGAPGQPAPLVESLVEPLTRREEEILRLLARGQSNKEISEGLHLTEGTVKNYISRIYAKLGARDRTQAALWALEHRILNE
jgi:DNA-binding NarL/FixJ family response regulator